MRARPGAARRRAPARASLRRLLPAARAALTRPPLRAPSAHSEGAVAAACAAEMEGMLRSLRAMDAAAAEAEARTAARAAAAAAAAAAAEPGPAEPAASLLPSRGAARPKSAKAKPPPRPKPPAKGKPQERGGEDADGAARQAAEAAAAADALANELLAFFVAALLPAAASGEAARAAHDGLAARLDECRRDLSGYARVRASGLLK